MAKTYIMGEDGYLIPEESEEQVFVMGDDGTLKPLPSATQRQYGGQMDTERSRMADRYRDLGYAESEIAELVNTPLATEGMSGMEKFRAGMGSAFTDIGSGAAQTLMHLTGMDTEGIDQFVQEQARLREIGGLNESGAALGGTFVGHAAPWLMAGGPLSKIGLLPATGIEVAADVMTTPVTDTDNYLAEKGRQAATSTLLGGGANLGGAALLKGAEGVRNAPRAAYDWLETPVRPGKQPIIRPNASDLAEGRALAQRTGIGFSPSEISGSKGQQQLEQLVRESLFTSDKVADIDLYKSGQFERLVDDYMDTLGPSVPREVAATKLQSFVNDKANELFDTRRSMADSDYGVIRADTSPIMAPNLEKELRKIVEEGSGVGASTDQKTAARIAQDRLNIMDESGGSIIGKDVDMLTRANDVERTGNVWKTREASYEKFLNNRVRDAVEADVRASNPTMYQNLQKAKANYTANSNAIDALQASGLGKIVGKEFASDILGITTNQVSPSKVFQKFWSQDPVDMKVAMQFLDATSPEVSNALRRQFVEDSIKASKIRPAAGGTGEAVNYGGFLRALGVTGGDKARLLNMERIEAMFRGTPGEPLANDIIESARRLGDMSSANTSRTAIRQETNKIIENIMKLGSLTMGALRTAGGTIGTAIGLRGVANRMDPRSPNYLSGPPRYQASPVTTGRVQTLPAIPALYANRMMGEEDQ